MASVAGLCVISSVSAYAAPKLYSKYFSDKGKVSTSINVNADNECIGDVEKIISGEISEVPEIKLTFNYLPEGFTNNGKDDYTLISETGKNISVGDIYGKWSSFLQKENKNNNVNSKYNYIDEKE